MTLKVSMQQENAKPALGKEKLKRGDSTWGEPPTPKKRSRERGKIRSKPGIIESLDQWGRLGIKSSHLLDVLCLFSPHISLRR